MRFFRLKTWLTLKAAGGTRTVSKPVVGWAMLDIQSLLQPVTADAPSGPNREYSPEFAELERTAQGKPERQLGELIVAAEDPDWGAVIEQSVAFLRSSKDLRVASQLARALLRAQGYAGFADGLALFRGLVEGFWDHCHPQLDAEDDKDPTARINAVAELAHRDVLLAVRTAPLVKSKALGVVTLRDIAAGDAAGGKSATAEGAFQEVPSDVLASAAGAVHRCREEARALEQAWNARLESRGPDFTELTKILAQADEAMKARVAQRAGARDGAPPSGGPQPSNGQGRAMAVGGELRSREDVVRALEAICTYYARHEPSSPVPVILQRCKRLVSMSFLDIVKDMLPDGLTTIETITGKQSE